MNSNFPRVENWSSTNNLNYSGMEDPLMDFMEKSPTIKDIMKEKFEKPKNKINIYKLNHDQKDLVEKLKNEIFVNNNNFKNMEEKIRVFKNILEIYFNVDPSTVKVVEEGKLNNKT